MISPSCKLPHFPFCSFYCFWIVRQSPLPFPHHLQYSLWAPKSSFFDSNFQVVSSYSTFFLYFLFNLFPLIGEFFLVINAVFFEKKKIHIPLSFLCLRANSLSQSDLVLPQRSKKKKKVNYMQYSLFRTF